METRVIVSDHAETRISERGDDIVTIVSTIRQASSHILSAGISAGSRRVALVSARLSTVPVIEISPRKYGVGLVIVTVLPRPTRVIPHPVVALREEPL